MDKMPDETIEKLAKEHWEYTEKVILRTLQLAKLAYIESFKHGFKHGEGKPTQRQADDIHGD